MSGRTNPFAPMTATQISTESSGPSVVTDQPTDITTNSAVLNGLVSSSENITDTYFQYGSSAQGTSLIATAKQSLVGTFINNIVGLIPKTTYFYKACAKINNIANCGDVISFTTN